MEFGRRPVLYFSPADQRLHLLDADSGVWNLGDGHYLLYENLDGDAYLDQWQELQDGVVIQQLNSSQGAYVHAVSGTVRLTQTGVGPALFETQPPGNNEEWKQLDAQLKAHQSATAPLDFAATLEQLGRPQVQIDGATVRDLRITPQGLRFILDLSPEFRTLRDQVGLSRSLSGAGAYAVEYDGAAWTARRARPLP